MAYSVSSRRDRAGAAGLAAGLTALIGLALAMELGVSAPRGSDDALDVFSALPTAPPPKPRTVPKPRRSRRPEGAAAPPNLRSRATEVVAPAPVVPLPAVAPVVAAPVANLGTDATQGAAERPGPGTGAGGYGTGTGSGGSGDGDGGGWTDETPPRRLRGRLKDSDYPREAADLGQSGTVSVRYFVEVDGRVTGCRVTRSSGSAALDGTTCRLIERRFRYDPSRDAAGRPVRSVVVVDHEWVMERAPAE